METRWKNYLHHGHHVNAAFDGVEYLILLSAETPPPDALECSPPRIVHIDRQHFLAWYEKAVAPELLGKGFGARVAIVAGAMQHYWTTICSDVDREMNCDGCAYFGDGGFGEATPFYQDLAARFLSSAGLTDNGRAELRGGQGRIS